MYRCEGTRGGLGGRGYRCTNYTCSWKGEKTKNENEHEHEKKDGGKGSSEYLGMNVHYMKQRGAVGQLRHSKCMTTLG